MRAGQRFRVYRVLISLGVLLAALVLLFPAMFAPRVEAPADLAFGSASSVQVQVANQNFTPLNDVEYSCQLSKLTPADGSAISNANALIRGSIRRIPGRKAMTVHCESAYFLTVPLKEVEYTLTLRYRAWPWPQLRSTVNRIAARIDSKGQVTGWKAD